MGLQTLAWSHGGHSQLTGLTLAGEALVVVGLGVVHEDVGRARVRAVVLFGATMRAPPSSALGNLTSREYARQTHMSIPAGIS